MEGGFLNRRLMIYILGRSRGLVRFGGLGNYLDALLISWTEQPMNLCRLWSESFI